MGQLKYVSVWHTTQIEAVPQKLHEEHLYFEITEGFSGYESPSLEGLLWRGAFALVKVILHETSWMILQQKENNAAPYIYYVS